MQDGQRDVRQTHASHRLVNTTTANHVGYEYDAAIAASNDDIDLVPKYNQSPTEYE